MGWARDTMKGMGSQEQGKRLETAENSRQEREKQNNNNNKTTNKQTKTISFMAKWGEPRLMEAA